MTEPDFFLLHCRKLERLEPEWRIFSWRVVNGGGGRTFFELEGAVCTEVFKSGPRKGDTNWKKLRPDTRRKFLILKEDHEAFELEWEHSTGMCRKCGGTAQVLRSWHRDTGAAYAPCAAPIHARTVSP